MSQSGNNFSFVAQRTRRAEDRARSIVVIELGQLDESLLLRTVQCIFYLFCSAGPQSNSSGGSVLTYLPINGKVDEPPAWEVGWPDRLAGAPSPSFVFWVHKVQSKGTRLRFQIWSSRHDPAKCMPNGMIETGPSNPHPIWTC